MTSDSGKTKKRGRRLSSLNHDSLLKDGANLSGKEARSLEAISSLDPNDLAYRLKLIGYYEFGKNDSNGAFPHLLWLIDNHLDHEICYGLHFDERYSKRQLEKYREHLMQQVSLNPSNHRVIGNAASMIAGTDCDLSERLFRSAQELNQKEPRWTRRLADIYRHKAIFGSRESRKRNAHLAIVETEKALLLRDALGEHVGLLLTATPMALEFRYFEAARTWSARLLRLGRKYEYPLWEESACIFRARVELAESNFKRSKTWLKKALSKIKEDPDYIAKNNRLMDLLNELLEANETQVVKEALQVSMQKSSSVVRRQIKDWLAQLDTDRRPTLKF